MKTDEGIKIDELCSFLRDIALNYDKIVNDAEAEINKLKSDFMASQQRLDQQQREINEKITEIDNLSSVAAENKRLKNQIDYLTEEKAKLAGNQQRKRAGEIEAEEKTDLVRNSQDTLNEQFSDLSR